MACPPYIVSSEDSQFNDVTAAMRAERASGAIEHLYRRQISLRYLRGNSRYDPRHWSHPYHVTRTAAVTIRRMALHLTKTRRLVDPALSSPSADRNEEHWQLSPANGRFSNLEAHPDNELLTAHALIDAIDRLYPHFVMQHKIPKRGTREFADELWCFGGSSNIVWHLRIEWSFAVELHKHYRVKVKVYFSIYKRNVSFRRSPLPSPSRARSATSRSRSRGSRRSRSQRSRSQRSRSRRSTSRRSRSRRSSRGGSRHRSIRSRSCRR